MNGERDTVSTPEFEQPNRPRIYVASLSDYNAGILHGVWLDATVEADDLWTGVNEMLAGSPTTRRYGDVAEEWAIHDYEGFTRFVHLGESERLERVGALARGLVAHGDAFGAWWALDTSESTDDDELEAAFAEQYLGEYDSVEDYGEQILEDMGVDLDSVAGIPEGLRPYVRVDVEAWTRDMQYGGEITTVESHRGVYVFCQT
jgi:antirestriction protein